MYMLYYLFQCYIDKLPPARRKKYGLKSALRKCGSMTFTVIIIHISLHMNVLFQFNEIQLQFPKIENSNACILEYFIFEMEEVIGKIYCSKDVKFLFVQLKFLFSLPKS